MARVTLLRDRTEDIIRKHMHKWEDMPSWQLADRDSMEQWVRQAVIDNVAAISEESSRDLVRTMERAVDDIKAEFGRGIAHIVESQDQAVYRTVKPPSSSSSRGRSQHRDRSPSRLHRSQSSRRRSPSTGQPSPPPPPSRAKSRARSEAPTRDPPSSSSRTTDSSSSKKRSRSKSPSIRAPSSRSSSTKKSRVCYICSPHCFSSNLSSIGNCARSGYTRRSDQCNN